MDHTSFCAAGSSRMTEMTCGSTMIFLRRSVRLSVITVVTSVRKMNCVYVISSVQVNVATQSNSSAAAPFTSRAASRYSASYTFRRFRRSQSPPVSLSFFASSIVFLSALVSYIKRNRSLDCDGGHSRVAPAGALPV
jgi:hypothetical protein